MPVPALMENVPQAIRAIGYTDWQTFLIEFGIVVMLFFTAIKQALSVGGAARQSYAQHNLGGFGHNIFGTTQYRQTNNILALIMGFGAAYLLFFRYKITLGTVAENGLMTGLFALAAAMTTYGFMSARLSQENRFFGFFGAAIVGLIVYAWLSLKTASFSGAIGGFVPLLIFGLFLLAFARFGAPTAVGAGGGGGIDARLPPGFTTGGTRAGAPPAAHVTTTPVPAGPAGAPVVADNASRAVEAAAAAVQETTVTVNNAAPLAERLDAQHERTERAAGDAVSAAERAEEEVEEILAEPSLRFCSNCGFDRVPTDATTCPSCGQPQSRPTATSAPEPDIYSRNVMGAAEEARELAAEIQKETALADQIASTWGNISEEGLAVRDAEAASMTEYAERALETIESSVRNEPAAAPAVQILEEERHNLAAAREMLTTGTSVAVREAGFLRESIKQDTAQIVRWKEEVRPIAASIMALVSSIEQKKLPPPKVKEALVELGTLEKRFIQVTESHGVDVEAFKNLLPAVRSRLQQSAKTLVQVNNILETSQRKLTAVPRALLAAPKGPEIVSGAPPGAVEAEIIPPVKTVGELQELLRKLKECNSLIALVKMMNSEKNESNETLTKRVYTSVASIVYDFNQIKTKATPAGGPTMSDLANVIGSFLPSLNEIADKARGLFNSYRGKEGRRAEVLAAFNANNYNAVLQPLIQALDEIENRLVGGAGQARPVFEQGPPEAIERIWH